MMATQEIRELLDMVVKLELLVLADLKGLQGLLDQRVLQEPRVLMVFRATQDLLELSVIRALLDLLVIQGLRVLLVTLVPQERLVLKETQELLD